MRVYRVLKKRDKKKNKGLRFAGMQPVIAVFLLLACALCFVQFSVPYKSRELLLEPQETSASVSSAEQSPECMIFWQDDAAGENGLEMMEAVLGGMKVPYDTCEGSRADQIFLDEYRTVVISMTDYSILSSKLLDILDWTRRGGRLMILYPPEVNGSFQSISSSLGIEQVGNSYAVVEGLHFTKGFMTGGEGKDFKITDPYESSLAVVLKQECEVYLESDGEHAVPLIWKKEQGEGRIVVCNLGFLEKAYRGFYSSAYSLLQDVFAYPVINASTFYIDDFPSPVPGGNSEYIERNYGMSISDFYTNVWWRDVYSLAEEYGIRYTGLVIEQYSDGVEPPFERNDNIQRYRYFGNMLLAQGGEIGFHGYNHMPLCTVGFDYKDEYDSYRLWKTYDDMKASITELKEFCETAFPREKFQVYVPPSNILSAEGREALKETTDIKAIASVYLPDASEIAYDQEFEVAEDGIVETPRVISGYIMDDYTQIAALSELNFHYVNTHFQHPDDTLDEDRGAALGWEEMFDRLSDYIQWLYTSAPDIRNLTGTELAGAVQIYDDLQVRREESEQELKLTLDGFRGEAWIMIRFNEGMPGEVDGGSMEKVGDGLYLLRAESENVTIKREGTR